MNKNYYTIDPPEGWRYGFPKAVTEEEYNKITDLKEWCVSNHYPRDVAISYGEHFNIGISGPIPCVDE